MPVKIGAVLSLTGFAAYYGENSKNGMDLAVDEINQAGGINGIPLQIIYEDDATDGKTAVTAAQKMIDTDKIAALLGGTWDVSLGAMVPIADSSKILLINPSTGNNEEGTRLSPYLFRLWSPTAKKVRAYAPILDKENIKTVVLFRNSGAWALGHKKALEKLLKERGGSLFGDIVGVNVDDNNFYTEITKAKSLSPDAVFLALGLGDTSNVIRRMKEQGFKAKILGAEGTMEVVTKNMIVPQDAEGAYFVDLVSTDPGFIEKYTAKYGKPPGISADTAYKAVQVLAQAYKTTGTTDTEKIRAYLQSLPLFDEYGDIIMQIPIYQIQSGKPVLVSK